MRLNATCFVPKASSSGQAGNLTSVTYTGTLIEGTEAISGIGTLHTIVDDQILLDGVQAVSEVQAFGFETEVSVSGVEAQSQTEGFRLPTLTKYPNLLYPSANVIKSSVRLFGVAAKGQANALRCATTYDVLLAVAA